jgi:hypothetical protein
LGGCSAQQLKVNDPRWSEVNQLIGQTTQGVGGTGLLPLGFNKVRLQLSGITFHLHVNVSKH